MGGGILQLAAFGSQDVALVGNPQITFFKQIYKRHSPFAIESIEQTFNGTADFGRQVTATVARTGDLVTSMFLEIELPELYSAAAGVGYNFVFELGGANDPGATQAIEGPLVRWANSIGHALLKSVELEIGGFRIDKHLSEWIDIWHELSEPEERVPGLNEMIGKYDDFDVSDTTGKKSSRAARTRSTRTTASRWRSLRRARGRWRVASTARPTRPNVAASSRRASGSTTVRTGVRPGGSSSITETSRSA